MTPSDSALLQEATRAYERGRMRRALVRAVRVLPVIAVALVVQPLAAIPCAFAVLLFVAAFAFDWRSHALGRTVLPGLVAGAVPLVCLLAERNFGHGCTGRPCLSTCMTTCAVTGLVAGAIVSFVSLKLSERRRQLVLAAALIAALTAALGCGWVGGTGLAVVAGALLISSTPGLVLARPRIA